MPEVMTLAATVDGVAMSLELQLLRTSATSLLVRTVAPGPDRPEWTFESAYLGAISTRTRSVHLLAWRAGSASASAEHRDGLELEACLPVFRPAACAQDHLMRLAELLEAQFGARLAVDLDDELTAEFQAAGAALVR